MTCFSHPDSFLYRGKITLTESIPTDLSLRHFEEDTYDSWKRIISSARETIEIACYYMSLTDGMDFHPGQGGWKGQSIFDSLKVAKNQHGVKIRIAQNLPTPNMPDKDTSNLSRLGVAEVRSLDFPKLLKGYLSNRKPFLQLFNDSFKIWNTSHQIHHC